MRLLAYGSTEVNVVFKWLIVQPDSLFGDIREILLIFLDSPEWYLVYFEKEKTKLFLENAVTAI